MEGYWNEEYIHTSVYLLSSHCCRESANVKSTSFNLCFRSMSDFSSMLFLDLVIKKTELKSGRNMMLSLKHGFPPFRKRKESTRIKGGHIRLYLGKSAAATLAAATYRSRGDLGERIEGAATGRWEAKGVKGIPVKFSALDSKSQ